MVRRLHRLRSRRSNLITARPSDALLRFSCRTGTSHSVTAGYSISSLALDFDVHTPLQLAVSATWLFFSAIPTLLAFKRAAESLEKLMDVTREELPDTMAAVRLSGMEISDLTMELSDLGQEITQGVRSSTRAVRLAEDRLRRLTNMTPPGGGKPKK